MKKNEILLKKWLADSKRKYAEGVVLFDALATDTLKKKYGHYFKNVDSEEQPQFSPHMSILTNKLTQIGQMMKVNPELFKDAEIIEAPADTTPEIEAKLGEIKNLETRVDELKEELKSLEDDSDLQSELEEKELALEELQAELAELEKKRGLQIVARKDLPKKLQKLYARNQEITPLMAALHAEIGVETTSEEKRKELVDELCKLDDERRANWDLIDDWSEGKEVKADEAETKPAYDPDPVLAGMQIARRIDRLKENIKRSQDSAENGKSELIRTNAAKRVEAYRAELAELEDRSPKEAKDDTE